jgi:hypothetical protein
MCIIAAKYFEDIGWVGCKNRDRSYKPNIKFQLLKRNQIDKLVLRDEITGYTEGINEFGICILNASTSSVKKDEKEATIAKNKRKQNDNWTSPDGLKIRKALSNKNIDDVLESLIRDECTGNFLVFNEDECHILEAGFIAKLQTTDAEIEDEDKYIFEFVYKSDKISKKGGVVVRTNHGILIPQLGYQRGIDEKMDNSRTSSEKRYETVLKQIQKIQNPEQLLNCVSITKDKNPQLNPLRTKDPKKKSELCTTGQIVLYPEKLKMEYRPIWGDVNLSNINKINGKSSNLFLSILPFNWDEVIVDVDKNGSEIVKEGRTSFKDFVLR